MEMSLKFILRPGLKSVYCNAIDKYVYQDGITTNDQKIIGELCKTDGVFLEGSKQYHEMLKDEERIKAFRIAQAKRDEEKRLVDIEREKAEAIAAGEREREIINAVKPTGADKARVDEIRQSLEKEIADKGISKTSNKRGKR